MEDLKELMQSALASYEAAGVEGSEGARAMRGALARIEELERERDEARADIVAFSEMAASLIEEMSKRPGTTWGQVKAAVRALGDLGDRQAFHAREARADRLAALLKEAEEAMRGIVEIVEGVRGAMEHGTWRAERSNLRMKDTPEWVALYNIHNRIARLAAERANTVKED